MTTALSGGGYSAPVTATFGAGDGYIYKRDANWDTAHNASAGDNVKYTENKLEVYTGKRTSASTVSDYDISRAFLSIKTSALTDAEVEEASKIVAYVNSAELWIGVKDYYLYKATVGMAGEAGEGKPNMNVTISMQGSDYNNAIKIESPQDAKEFNPLELLMLYSAASTTATEPADGTVTEEALIEDGTTDTPAEETTADTPTEEVTE